MSPPAEARRGRFEIYRSGFFIREWYWRYVAPNGNEVFRSSEGYRNKIDCLTSIPRCSTVESAYRKEV
jgi:uncharacterized protein YegP (UPF0339 family)